MRQPAFCICEHKDADQLISAFFFFAIRIVQFLFFPNLKFQASNHPVCLYSLVCVGPGRTARRPDFSQRGSNAANNQGADQNAQMVRLIKAFSVSIGLKHDFS